jgi:POT family proton-dependent oligopeptide transporter
MWTRLGNRAPTTPRKFAYGVIGMGLAFLLFLPMSGTTGKAVPALLVVGIMAVFAVSELLLSPIGLSVTSKPAPEAFRAQMMALYFRCEARRVGCTRCTRSPPSRSPW